MSVLTAVSARLEGIVISADDAGDCVVWRRGLSARDLLCEFPTLGAHRRPGLPRLRSAAEAQSDQVPDTVPEPRTAGALYPAAGDGLPQRWAEWEARDSRV